MATDGGEARQVTKAPNGVEMFAWKPDGTGFAFGAEPEEAKRPKFDDSFEIDANDYLAQAAPSPVHLHAIAASGDEATLIASGTWSVPGLFATLSWSPDGRTLTFTRQDGAGTRNWETRSLARVDIATGAVSAVAGLEGRACGAGWPSPDGAFLLATCS